MTQIYLTYLKSIPIILVTGMLFACKNDIEEIKAITEDRELPLQIVKNGTFHYTEEGRLINTLEAAELKRFGGDTPRIEVSGGFIMFMYDSLEQLDATLSASRGTFYDNEHRLEAEENVLVINKDLDSLFTEELFWVQDSNLVYSNKFVQITTKDGTIFSNGLVTDSHFSKYRLQQVSGDMIVEEPEKEE